MSLLPMRKLIILLSCILVSLVPAARAESIYSMILDGKLKEASDSLSSSSTASLRDGNRLFYLSLLESDGTKAAQLMEAALLASVAPVFREEIHYRLAQYYFAEGDMERLGRIVSDYRSMWENGRYLSDMLRFSVYVDQNAGAFEAAVRQVDRYLMLFPEGDPAQLGVIDKARVMMNFNKRVGSDKLLRKLARDKQGIGVPQALYLLALESVRTRRTDDAVFYYNLLREGYPSAVGLDALIDRMMDISTSESADDAAARLTGTFYSVQVGVFSEKDNAKRQADLFKTYGKKVEIKTKTISNIEYRVVYVGRFQSYDDAVKFKRRLEANHDAVYQVAAR
jgi:tetratricopeptide (TPR) repeat protein